MRQAEGTWPDTFISFAPHAQDEFLSRNQRQPRLLASARYSAVHLVIQCQSRCSFWVKGWTCDGVPR